MRCTYVYNVFSKAKSLTDDDLSYCSAVGLQSRMQPDISHHRCLFHADFGMQANPSILGTSTSQGEIKLQYFLGKGGG